MTREVIRAKQKLYMGMGWGVPGEVALAWTVKEAEFWRDRHLPWKDYEGVMERQLEKHSAPLELSVSKQDQHCQHLQWCLLCRGLGLLPDWLFSLDKVQFVTIPLEMGPRDAKPVLQLHTDRAERASSGHFCSCRWSPH